MGRGAGWKVTGLAERRVSHHRPQGSQSFKGLIWKKMAGGTIHFEMIPLSIWCMLNWLRELVGAQQTDLGCKMMSPWQFWLREPCRSSPWEATTSSNPLTTQLTCLAPVVPGAAPCLPVQMAQRDELCLPKRYVQVVAPGTCEGNLIGIRVFVDKR